MCRDRGRCQLEHGGHLADAELALPKHGDEPLPNGMRERFMGFDGSGQICHFVTTRNIARVRTGRQY